MKRIVTGHSADGKSVFLSEGPPPRVLTFERLPGLEFVELWATEGTPALPSEEADPTLRLTSFTPEAGGTRFRLVQFPPDEAVLKTLILPEDVAAFQAELRAKIPGLGEVTESQDPAMHTTDTVDYGIVLSGEIWLELDDGAAVHLAPGDCVVQQGTRHAWRNRSAQPCVMAFILVGAARESP